MNTSLEHMDSSPMSPSSPPPICSIQPRKLRFQTPDKDEQHYHHNQVKGEHKICRTTRGALNFDNFAQTSGVPLLNTAISPPYRKVRALRLFDTPATPKTILQKSSSDCTNHLSTDSVTDAFEMKDKERHILKTAEKPRSLPLHNRVLDNIMNQQTANINPFTPDSLRAQNKKRGRIQFGENKNNNSSLLLFLNSDDSPDNNNEDGNTVHQEMHQAPKRLALQDTNISRYGKEFVELAVIGVGEFGKVYQCLNRLDGCIYAIKKSIRPVAGSSFEKRALNEVWAHAVLGKHDNVVRYYSAWAEDNHMLIQNEYCNGGSLHSLLQQRTLAEAELRILLFQVAEGLRYIHSNDLVHMDLKPGNIFFTKQPTAHKSTLPPLTKECYETGMDGVYEELIQSECLITYKIGDLGHVTSIKEPSVEEGDCHYLPRELLNDDYRNLDKADIFALGLTLYEAAGGGPLPKNGPVWHELRDGNVPNLCNVSAEFNDLIKIMTHPNPEKRPSSTSIFNHPVLNSLESKSKDELSQELIIEKRKNELLLGKLREARKSIKLLELAARANNLGLKSPKSSQKNRSPHRFLRSYTRNKHRLLHSPRNISSKLKGRRDRNKNVIQFQ